AVVDTRPFLAAVIGTEEPAVVRLDHRVYPLAIRRRDANSYLPIRSLRQTFFLLSRSPGLLVSLSCFGRPNLFPRIAPVAGNKQPAARPAAGQLPRLAARLPHSSKENPRVIRIEANIRRAGVQIIAENALPRFATVGGSIHPAIFVWAKRVA